MIKETGQIYKIKLKARELGFSRVGITKADSLEYEGRLLREWLANGYHASMKWMERDAEKRVNPAGLLPNAKSIICVAANYCKKTSESDDPAIGKISRYARGDDYHKVLSGRLQNLLNYIIAEFPGANGKLYVDTGPVMEKALAVRAGIGWLGKHTNIITRDFGSWIFLGEIILDIELDYDRPVQDLCGSCTKCIDACPTHAIIKPYVIDSNLCISYLTIEHRGELPPALMPKFNNWVFGCDICQEVCPWNRFQKETTEPAFQPREYNLMPRLVDLAGMEQEEFDSRFRHSAVKRTKNTGLKRNARALIDCKRS
jgi:epoxyqueuosine reductase